MATNIRKSVDPDDIAKFYEFDETNDFKLGTGAFGSVYKALHKPSNYHVAMKVIDKTLDDYWTTSDSVDREIEILALLPRAHNIMECFEVLETNVKLYIVGDLFDGEELFNVVNNKLRLSEADACHYFYNLIKITQCLESHCIAHRDIKAENILVNVEKDLLMMVDFGFAVKFKAGEHLGEFSGSRLYAAPEILTKERHDPIKADIWSLGVLLYYMLAGVLPFYDTNEKDLSTLIIMGEFKMPSIINQEAQDLIRQILNTSAFERPSFDDILNHPWMDVRKLHGKDIHSIDWSVEYQIIEREAKARVISETLADSAKMDIFGVTDKKEIEAKLAEEVRNPLITYLRVIFGKLVTERVDQIKVEIDEEICMSDPSDEKNEPLVAMVKSKVKSDKIANATPSRGVKSSSSEEFDLDAEFDDTKKTVNNETLGGYRPYLNAKYSMNTLVSDTKIYGCLHSKTIVPKRDKRLKKRCASNLFMIPGSDEKSTSDFKYILRKGVSTIIDIGIFDFPTSKAESATMGHIPDFRTQISPSTFLDDQTPLNPTENEPQYEDNFSLRMCRNRILPDDLESEATIRFRDVTTPFRKASDEPDEYRWNESPITSSRFCLTSDLDDRPIYLDLSSFSGCRRQVEKAGGYDSDLSNSYDRNSADRHRSQFSLSPVGEQIELPGTDEQLYHGKRLFQIDLLQVECEEASKDETSSVAEDIHPEQYSCIVAHSSILEIASSDDVIPCYLPQRGESPELQNTGSHSKAIVQKLLREDSYFGQMFRKKHQRFTSSIESLSNINRLHVSRQASNYSYQTMGIMDVNLNPIKSGPLKEYLQEALSKGELQNIKVPQFSARNCNSKIPSFDYRRLTTASCQQSEASISRRSYEDVKAADAASQFTGSTLRESLGKMYKTLKMPTARLQKAFSKESPREPRRQLRLRSEAGSPCKPKTALDVVQFDSMQDADLQREIAELRAGAQDSFADFTNIEAVAQDLRSLRPAFEEAEDDDRASSELTCTDKTAATERKTPFQIHPLRGLDPDSFVLRGLDLVTELSAGVAMRLVKAILLKNGLDPYMVGRRYADEEQHRVQMLARGDRDHGGGPGRPAHVGCERGRGRRGPAADQRADGQPRADIRSRIDLSGISG